MGRGVKILYYSPAAHGGIADYAHEQANALADLGTEVTLLCTPRYVRGRGEKYAIAADLKDAGSFLAGAPRWLKRVDYVRATLRNFKTLARQIKASGSNYVLLGSYQEYLAPLWAPEFKKLAARGVVFGAILHDPVRDYVVGPRGWHRWSVAEGYSFLREAFVHEPIQLDTVRPVPGLRTTVIPMGPFRQTASRRTREEMRRSLDLPGDAPVLLAFGHIHPNRKNLDLIIHSLKHHPSVYLVVAGSDESTGQKVVEAYKKLAADLGVADRCRWHIDYIPNECAGDYFVAADLVALVYKGMFRSASAVLNVAAVYRKPCIASSGAGNLRSVVEKYRLGVWVEPDNLDTLVSGIRRCLDSGTVPDWDRYLAENSWETNAAAVIEKMEAPGRLRS